MLAGITWTRTARNIDKIVKEEGTEFPKNRIPVLILMKEQHSWVIDAQPSLLDAGKSRIRTRTYLIMQYHCIPITWQQHQFCQRGDHETISMLSSEVYKETSASHQLLMDKPGTCNCSSIKLNTPVM
jgi:hypothetical protein